MVGAGKDDKSIGLEGEVLHGYGGVRSHDFLRVSQLTNPWTNQIWFWQETLSCPGESMDPDQGWIDDHCFLEFIGPLNISLAAWLPTSSTPWQGGTHLRFSFCWETVLFSKT